jgi:hypothetical protein
MKLITGHRCDSPVRATGPSRSRMAAGRPSGPPAAKRSAVLHGGIVEHAGHFELVSLANGL